MNNQHALDYFQRTTPIMNMDGASDDRQEAFEQLEACQRCGKNPPEVIPKNSTFIGVCGRCEIEIQTT